MLNSRLKYWFGYCKNNGVPAFLIILLRYVYLNLYLRRRFLFCGALNLASGFQIAGYKNISIKSISSGPRLRMDAIMDYYGVKYNPALKIGANLSLGSDVHIGCISSITIGDNVLIGSRVTIIDHDHGVYSGSEDNSLPETPPVLRQLWTYPINIGNNVHVGDGAIILKGVDVGAGSIISAGAVVTRDVQPNTIVAGNPAKTVKSFNFSTMRWERKFILKKK